MLRCARQGMKIYNISSPGDHLSAYPQTIQLDDIANIIAEKFKDQTAITCYVGSNAATPTAAIEALTRALKYQPEVVIMKVSRHSHTGEFSLGLSVEALHTAIDHASVVIAELDPGMPFTHGQSMVDAASIDYLVEEGIQPVYDFPAPDFDNLPPAERRIGALITEYFIQDGVTLQVGIGKIPDAVVGTIRDAQPKNLGIQTELYGDGLMLLQKSGIVTNRKKSANMGYSTTSLIMGSRELYDYVHMRSGVQMRPSSYTNAAKTIQANCPFVSVNTAIGVDLFGNVWRNSLSGGRAVE